MLFILALTTEGTSFTEGNLENLDTLKRRYKAYCYLAQGANFQVRFLLVSLFYYNYTIVICFMAT